MAVFRGRNFERTYLVLDRKACSHRLAALTGVYCNGFCQGEDWREVVVERSWYGLVWGKKGVMA